MMKVYMRILSKASWSLALLAGLLLSCSQDDDDKITTDAQVKAQEVRMEFVDGDNHDLVKDDLASFRVFTADGMPANTHSVADNRNHYLAFTPALPTDSIGKDSVNMTYQVQMGNKAVAEVACTFRLDSVRQAFGNKRYYYSTTERSYNRGVNGPVKVLVGDKRTYREEGDNRIYVVFHFPASKLQSTEDLDYHVTIKGFMGQTITPSQRVLAEGEGANDSTIAIVLGIDGQIHNYYDESGRLQEPYDITYEINSQQLFGNDRSHTVRMTLSGNCDKYKILSCSLDGQPLNLATVINKDMFGREYPLLTFE